MSLRLSLLAAVALAAAVRAQDPTVTLRGTLRTGSPMVHGYVIELSNLATHVTLDRIEVASDGEFIARPIPYGDYLVRVATYHGDTVAQQFVAINQMSGPLELRLPERAPSPTGGTVSVRQLRNPPPRKAVDASLSAQRFAESGKFGEAVGELEKAVRISPDFALAHSNLGANYLRLGRLDDAILEIRRALEIAGPNPHDLSNLAFAQLSQERFEDAEASARAALKLQKDASPAHYVLGLVQVLQPETRGEGLAHLEEAAKRMDSAKRALAALGR